jgi:hypothetical protein
MWQQHREAISDSEGPHFHVGMAAMTKYEQYLFDLQHTTTRTVIQQCLCMATYDECHIASSCELTQLKCENDLLCGGTIPPSNQDRELMVVYHHLSEAEHA